MSSSVISGVALLSPTSQLLTRDCYRLALKVYERLSRSYSSVGIATRYGPDGPEIESRGGRCSAPVQTGPGTHPAPNKMDPGSFPGVKRTGRDVNHPPTSSAEVKERVVLYLYSPLGLRGLFEGNFYLYPYVPKLSG
jgi:hypothetical protein